MSRLNLLDVNNRILQLAKKIGAPEYLLPGLTSTTEGAYIDSHAGDIYYIIKERGNIIYEKVAYDLEGLREFYLDEMLYSVFDHVTFEMALKFESANRIKGQDSRRMTFNKQEELLGTLQMEWRDKKQKEHDRIIQNAPFDDLQDIRMDFFKKLKNNGVSYNEAIKASEDKYPRPKRT